jgi:ethanolamine kinase
MTASAYRDNPTNILPVALDPAADDLPAAALDVVQQTLPAWQPVPLATVRMSAMTGGITNALLRLSAPGHNDVLVRIYGPETDRVIDRERENRLFARLSANGFAPPYLSRFENGRVEGFLEGFRPLKPDEMGAVQWRLGIAQQLATMHAMAPESTAPTTFETLQGWMQTARQVRFSGADDARHAALDLDRHADWLNRLQAAWQHRMAGPYTSDGARAAAATVLAHNDLLSGNVLVDDQTGAVRFIDYEYSDTGIAAFDVANHFCEYAGFDSDFARSFPTQAVRHDFINGYLGPTRTPTPTPTDIADFDALVRFFVLVNHLWWGSWAVVQARYSPIDFDFMDYARLRLAGLALHADEWGPDGARGA